MQLKSAKLIEDIRDAAAFILEATEGLTAGTFSSNRLVRQAVERNFQIIGEAARRLADHDPALAAKLGPVGQVITFRNIIVHGYDALDHEVVWSVVKSHLPALAQVVTALLENIKSAKN